MYLFNLLRENDPQFSGFCLVRLLLHNNIDVRSSAKTAVVLNWFRFRVHIYLLNIFRQIAAVQKMDGNGGNVTLVP